MKNKCLLIIVLFIVFQSCKKERVEDVIECTVEKQSNRIQEIADQYTNIGIPGLAIIYKKGNEPITEVYSGYASLRDLIPVGDCHHFHSASLAKTYFAALTLKLAEQGRIDLNSTIGDHLTGEYLEVLEGFEQTPIRFLLDHTSGIPNFYTAEHILKYFDDLQQTFTHLEMLEFIKGKDLEFEPGTESRYSDSNFLILALVLDQVVEGKNHVDLIYEELFQPLNLNDSYYDLDVNSPDLQEVVVCYNEYYGDGTLQNVKSIERKFAIMNIGHDSILGKPRDYFDFFYALMSGNYLNQPALDNMLTYVPYKLDFALHHAEGKGIRQTTHESNGTVRIGHFGATLGSGNAMLYYPETDSYLLVCSNFGRYFSGTVVDLFSAEYEEFGTSGNLIGDLENYLLE